MHIIRFKFLLFPQYNCFKYVYKDNGVLRESRIFYRRLYVRYLNTIKFKRPIHDVINCIIYTIQSVQ